MAAPTLLGPEWNLSESQGIADGTFTHLATSIAPLANGSFVSAVTFKSGIYIFIHNADGTVKSRSVLNATDEPHASFTALKDGGFVVAWHEQVLDYTTESLWASSIYAQVYNADGSVRTSKFQVNDVVTKTDYSPYVSALANGGFSVTYENNSVDGGGSTDRGIAMRMFDASGNPVGASQRVNDTEPGHQENASTAGLPGGGVVVVYSEPVINTPDELGATTIRGKVIINGVHSAEFVVPETSGGHQSDPQVAVLKDGRFVVTWMNWDVSNPEDGSHSSVCARIYNADGSPATGQFRVNTATEGWQHMPAITALKDGGFAIAYTHSASDLAYDRGDILVQRFGASGEKDGAEIHVNTTTFGRQDEPIIKELANGRLVVGWTNESLENGPDDARFQILDTGNYVPVPTNPTPTNPTPTNPTPTNPGTGHVVGNAASNVLRGSAEDNRVYGYGGHDRLYGEGGNDRLYGGAGKDKLWGGAGRDIFVFDTRLNSTSNLDELRDYSAREDLLQVEASLFQANRTLFAAIRRGTEERPVKLDRKYFAVDEARDRNDFFILDREGRKLVYDRNGDAEGGEVTILKFASEQMMRGFNHNEIFFI